MPADPQSAIDSPRKRGRPRDWHDKTAQNTIKSLDRAMQVFEHLSEGQGKSLSEIASETEQSSATVYRILVTLDARGLVEFDADLQQWYIGPRAFVIGARFLRRTNLVERARPILRALMEQTGETANLGVERDGLVMFLNQVETHESIRAFFPPGTLSQMHASGVGKALLAQMDQTRFEQWFGAHSPERFTEHTLVTKVALQAECERIRQTGYAVDAEEKTLGMHCIAAPVLNTYGEAIAGISVSGPTHRIVGEDIHRIGGCVQDAAKRLSLAIGSDMVDA